MPDEKWAPEPETLRWAARQVAASGPATPDTEPLVCADRYIRSAVSRLNNLADERGRLTHCHADGVGPCLALDCPLPLGEGVERACLGAPGPQHPVGPKWRQVRHPRGQEKKFPDA